MECSQIRPLLGAHLDEELDVINDAAVSAHLETCPHCAAELLLLLEQRQLLQTRATRHRAPADLAAAIRQALPREAAAGARAEPVVRFRWQRPLTLAAAAAVILGLGYGWGAQQARRGRFADEAIADYVRARLTGHAIEVVSTDQHTVKPWFNGRVDVAPPVPDLTSSGYPLLGGRIERLSGRTLATVVYGRRKHTIDLFVWSGEPTASPLLETGSGYSLLGWQAHGLNFIAVSDTAPDDLAQFRDAYLHTLEPEAP